MISQLKAKRKKEFMTNSFNFSDNSIFNPYFHFTDSFCMRYQEDILCKDGYNKGQK